MMSQSHAGQLVHTHPSAPRQRSLSRNLLRFVLVTALLVPSPVLLAQEEAQAADAQDEEFDFCITGVRLPSFPAFGPSELPEIFDEFPQQQQAVSAPERPHD